MKIRDIYRTCVNFKHDATFHIFHADDIEENEMFFEGKSSPLTYTVDDIPNKFWYDAEVELFRVIDEKTVHVAVTEVAS